MIGLNYLKIQDYGEAYRHIRKACNMCPNRFYSMYLLMQLHVATKDNRNAYRTAQEIVAKPIKVDSNIVRKIKQEMINYIQINKNKYE